VFQLCTNVTCYSVEDCSLESDTVMTELVTSQDCRRHKMLKLDMFSFFAVLSSFEMRCKQSFSCLVCICVYIKPQMGINKTVQSLSGSNQSEDINVFVNKTELYSAIIYINSTTSAQLFVITTTCQVTVRMSSSIIRSDTGP